jgi:hypothetical protein
MFTYLSECSRMLYSGCDSVLCALGTAVRDEPWGPLPGRGGRHRTAGHAGAGLDQSLPSRLAEQGMSKPFLILDFFSIAMLIIFGSWIRVLERKYGLGSV